MEEKFQWIVNRGGEPTLVYGEIVALGENEKTIVKHVPPENAMSVIFRVKSNDYQDYLAFLATTNLMNFLRH